MHVTLAFTMSEVGRAFGRDRSTVNLDCHLIEDMHEDWNLTGLFRGSRTREGCIHARRDSAPMTTGYQNGELRLLRFPAKGPAEVVGHAGSERMTLESRQHGAISIERPMMKSALGDGIATLREQELFLSQAGKGVRLRRLGSANDPYAGQHRKETTVLVADQQATMLD